MPEETLDQCDAEICIDLTKYNLTKFKLSRILNNNTAKKIITLVGNFPDISEIDLAIVILEKNAFTEKNVENSDEGFFTSDTDVDQEFQNNIYGNFLFFPSKKLNGIKATVIYPASEKHIEKYSTHKKYLVQETPELYRNITEKYLESEQFSLEWVYNILEHKQEQDRIVYEDTDTKNGFILLPDLKWDGHTMETLYFLAITHDRNIKSLRDLNSSHLTLLKNIRDAGKKAIKNRFNIKSSELRIYIHYQPSFYHFHVHFNQLNNDAPGIFCEKSHLLDTVINNIEMISDYYKLATIPFVVFEGNALYKEYRNELELIDNDQ